MFMRKLFIDDVRQAPDNSWTIARTITEAIRLLATQYWDIVSIDHDYGGIYKKNEEKYNLLEETYMPVAFYISKDSNYNRLYAKPSIFIHSGNKPAAQYMKDIIGENAKIVDYNDLNKY